jgi:hypothetical protein
MVYYPNGFVHATIEAGTWDLTQDQYEVLEHVNLQ